MRRQIAQPDDVRIDPRSAPPDSIRFSPHPSTVARPGVILPVTAGLICAVPLLRQAGSSLCALLLIAAAVLLPLAAAVCSLLRNRHTVCEISGDIIRTSDRQREKCMKLSSLDRLELCAGVFSKITGSVRVSFFSTAGKRAWLSVRVPKALADTLVRRTVAPDEETGRTVPGRYSSAVYALSSERATLFLLSSAVFTAFGGTDSILNAVALSLLAASLGSMLLRLATGSRLSFSRYRSGCRISSGSPCRRTVYVPEHSLIGAAVGSSPAGLLCGTGSVELLTAGGRLLPCMRGSSHEEMRAAAFRIVGGTGSEAASLREAPASAAKYTAGLTVSLFAAFLAGLSAYRYSALPPRFAACAAMSFFAALAIRSATGLQCAGSLGFGWYPSCLTADGISGCSAAFLCLKRSEVAGLRLRSSLLQRMDNLCSAEIFPVGSRRRLHCSGIGYDSIRGLASRFC